MIIYRSMHVYRKPIKKYINEIVQLHKNMPNTTKRVEEFYFSPTRCKSLYCSKEL